MKIRNLRRYFFRLWNLFERVSPIRSISILFRSKKANRYSFRSSSYVVRFVFCSVRSHYIYIYNWMDTSTSIRFETSADGIENTSTRNHFRVLYGKFYFSIPLEKFLRLNRLVIRDDGCLFIRFDHPTNEIFSRISFNVKRRFFSIDRWFDLVF